MTVAGAACGQVISTLNNAVSDSLHASVERGFTPLWTASTVRILELLLLKFGDSFSVEPSLKIRLYVKCIWATESIDVRGE